jgi:hypothetical protein
MRRYVRLQTSLREAGAPTGLGVFRATGDLMTRQALDPWWSECTEEICDWFNDHLTTPRLPVGQSRAVFWFRAEHSELVQRLWNLAHVLREHEVVVELLHTRNPGRICYEDQRQVAAIPWR